MKEAESVYALELRRSVGGYACVYVGRTGNVRRRVQEHARGCSRSAGWVRRHGGVKKRRALMIGLGAHEKPESWEEKETVAAMLAHPHGFACVRGWEFVNAVLAPVDYAAIKYIALGGGDLCRTCGAGGHYAGSRLCSGQPRAWLAACNQGIAGLTPAARRRAPAGVALSAGSRLCSRQVLRWAAAATVDASGT